MIKAYGLLFGQAIVALEEAKMFCIPLALQPGDRNFSDDEIKSAILNGTHLLRQACILSDMDGMLPDLSRLESLIQVPPPLQFPPRTAIGQAIVHLVARLQDELSQQFFFHLTQQDVRFYGQKALFGEVVAKKFKHAAEDIERAGNCLALQQPTACVFHLMRAMEIAVRQLGKRLKVTITPQTTWRQMTGQMDDKIKKMPESTDAQKRKKNDWEAARANLHHVGSVWRNNTMHPATSYTQSQALDVVNAVRVFMSGLCAL
jgi:hypothetical protein